MDDMSRSIYKQAECLARIYQNHVTSATVSIDLQQTRKKNQKSLQESAKKKMKKLKNSVISASKARACKCKPDCWLHGKKYRT